MPLPAGQFTWGLELEPVARLGNARNSTSVREDAALYPCTIAALSSDRFVAARTYAPGTLLAFPGEDEDPAELGGRGQGPGEFGTDLRLVTPTTDDRIWVVDNTNLRLAEIDADGEWLGSTRLPGRALSHAPLGDDEIILYTKPANSPVEGSPVIRRLDLGTGVAFPLLTVDPELAALELDQWVVNTTASGQVLAAQIWTGTVLIWEPGASNPARVIATRPNDRDAPELNASFLEGIHVTRPPPPSITHIELDTDGRLWVYWLMPDADWRPGMPGNSMLDWATATFDTEVLIIDPDDEELVARARFAFVLSPVCGRDLMYSVEWSGDGDVEAVVWQPRLVDTAPPAIP